MIAGGGAFFWYGHERATARIDHEAGDEFGR